ncbi:hypothetical protein N9B54_03120 [Mariniblastus sp.]|nr:hypothetical protein [Mariniblastus sp.]
MEEKDPQLVAVIEKDSQNNLLIEPTPMTVDLSEGKGVRFSLRVENGPEGLINLAIDSDQPWLQAEANRMTLVGGESGDCILLAKPEGDSEYANLMLSWEGTQETLSASFMVMRKLADGGSDGDGNPLPPSGNVESRDQAIKSLERFVDGCGGNDKFIDYEEEQKIFRKGGMLELALKEVESILNRRCAEGGWTRQTRLTEKLAAMLHEATQDDGLIDQKEYEHVVNFAVQRLMPRRDADEHCITLILDKGWARLIKQGIMNKWFDKKRKQYGL